MTKVEIVEEVARVSGATKRLANEHLEEIIRIIGNELKAGRDISIAGLGVFKVSYRKEREGTNPQTGEVIKIKATKSVSFKASKNMKEKLNNKL